LLLAEEAGSVFHGFVPQPSENGTKKILEKKN
jgi:hypothetical protein